MNIFPYMTKGLCWYDEVKALETERLSVAITRVLIKERGRQIRQRMRRDNGNTGCSDTIAGRKGPRDKGCGQPPEAGKTRKRISPQKLQRNAAR